jgi:hypothetical protein
VKPEDRCLKMITRERAEDIARRIVGAEPDDDIKGWELMEFDVGWVIRETADSSFRSTSMRVVERATGRVIRFPASVAPIRIFRDYSNVVSRGYVETLDD